MNNNLQISTKKKEKRGLIRINFQNSKYYKINKRTVIRILTIYCRKLMNWNQKKKKKKRKKMIRIWLKCGIYCTQIKCLCKNKKKIFKKMKLKIIKKMKKQRMKMRYK